MKKHHPPIEALEPRRLLAASVIDLLVVYTQGALSFHNNNTAELNNDIQGAVDSVNEAMQNSQIPVVIRLVHTDEVDYAESGDLFTDRTNLATIPNVQSLRNTYGADLIDLVVNESGNEEGGNAALPQNTTDLDSGNFISSACDVRDIVHGDYTLAHELGHNLGAGHERDNMAQPAPGIFSYSWGYRFTASDGNVYHDIMSYDPGIGIAYYANPAVDYLGVPTGVPIGQANEADLASTFKITAPIIANFRATVVGDTTGPQAALYETKLTGNQLDVTLRYADPDGVDASTFDNSDLLVNVPAAYGGFTLAARLLSIENGTTSDEYKLVTYRAVLPNNNPPVSSLTFSLQAGAVKDQSGNAAPAGIIANNTAAVAGAAYFNSRDLGPLTAPLTIYDSLAPASDFDIYRITITTAGTLDVHLDGLTDNGGVFLTHDVNGDGIYNYPQDTITGSDNPGATPESFASNVAAGVYYVIVNDEVVTPYALSIREYTDTTPPTASLDAADITTPTNQFVFNVKFHDDQELNAFLTQYYSPVRVTNPFGGYYVYFSDSIDSQVNAADLTVTYHINAGFTLSASDNGVYTVAMEPQNSSIFNPPLSNYVRDAAGNLLTPTALGSFNVSIGQADTIAPTVAQVSAANVPVGGMNAYTFTATYRDNVGIDSTKLDNSDLLVTGPKSFSQLAHFVSVTAAPTVGGLRTATYQITPPGGTWDAADHGAYSIVMQSGQVKDSAGNSVAAGTIGTFNVTVPLPGDANMDGTVDVTDLGILATNWQSDGKGWADGDFNLDGKVDVTDLGLLASNWQKNINSLSAPANAPSMPSLQSLLSSPPPVAPVRTPTRAAARPIDVLT